MAVQHPVPLAVGDEFDISGLRYADECGVAASPSRFLLPRAFPSRLPESKSMKMDRMMIHAHVDDSNSHALTVANNERR